MDKSFDIVIVGGGAAGLFAAPYAAADGARVAVVEKGKYAAKVKITGKGRCNLTNDRSPREFLEKVVTNPKFLYSAVYKFPPTSLMERFEELGVALKTERGSRVFPESDSALEIASTLTDIAHRTSTFVKGEVVSIIIDGGTVAGVKLADGTKLSAKAVIIATGGMSYPATGSDGSGYRIAKQAGHRIVEPVAALAPIILSDPFVKDLEGLSLKNVSLVCTEGEKVIFDEFGELLFTSDGISGPLTLTLSSYINRMDVASLGLYIDLKPALSEEVLDARLLREFAESGTRAFKNAIAPLLPKSLIGTVVEKSGIAPDKKASLVTATERKMLLRALKHFTLTPVSLAPIEQAIVTSGGVDVSGIDPGTMESKLVKNLFFAGEIIDVDALTGGYNLQTAFSTAYAAANAAKGRI